MLQVINRVVGALSWHLKCYERTTSFVVIAYYPYLSWVSNLLPKGNNVSLHVNAVSRACFVNVLSINLVDIVPFQAQS